MRLPAIKEMAINDILARNETVSRNEISGFGLMDEVDIIITQLSVFSPLF